MFQQLEQMGVPVLRHPQNCGKGRALKTGIAHMAREGFQAVITADADGQHSIDDICRIAQALAEHPSQLVMGARDIAQMVPRSRAGNSITQKLFRILHGISLQDTQTGLRGIPLTPDSMPALLELAGDRYEYEMEMLLNSRLLFPDGILEIPIQTIYLDQNQSSHFRPPGGRDKNLPHSVPGPAQISSLLPALLCAGLRRLQCAVLPAAPCHCPRYRTRPDF